MLRGVSRSAALALAMSVLVPACTFSEERALDNEAQFASARREAIPVGGTLVVASEFDAESAFDPQREYTAESWALLRCCLLRTMMSYSNLPVQEGGTGAVPDLAVEAPSVSLDGLEWTFRLRRGLHYAPPLEDVEIKAQDFIRALEREAKLGTYATYYSIVQGFDRFAAGDADSISGLETRDDRTLVVHVTEPVGHVAEIFSMPASAPIPPNPSAPDAELGVAQGHGKRYGRFLVASGPYMIEGAEDLDFSVPASQQEPVSGYDPGKRLVLVRNPSWRADDDPLRPAYVDRIVMQYGDLRAANVKAVNEGNIDLVLDSPHPTRQTASFLADPDLADRVLQLPASVMWYLPMNLAAPPFDDLHVRRAVNLVLNKARVVEGTLDRSFAHGHLGMDLFEGNLLLDYDPFRTPGSEGDVSRARAEMSLSRYDRNGDGLCDDAACTDVKAIAIGPPKVYTPRQLPSWVRSDFLKLGVDLKITETEDPGLYFGRLADGGTRTAIGIPAGFIQDFPNGAGYFPTLFSDETVGTPCCNFSLVGASPKQLHKWGYSTTRVPSVDPKIDECTSLVGDPQTHCWAEFDMMMMEKVVPWIPLATSAPTRIAAERVVHHSFDSLSLFPALDHFAVEGE